MSTITSVAPVSVGYEPSTTSKTSAISASTADLSSTDAVVSISNTARALQSQPSGNVYDPANLMIFGEAVDSTKNASSPPETVEFIPASDVAGIKQHIRDDFLSVGVYVDDAYVNAFYDAITDINTPGGIVPPNMELPEPPSWWTGYWPPSK